MRITEQPSLPLTDRQVRAWIAEYRHMFPINAQAILLVRTVMEGKKRRVLMCMVPYVTKKLLNGDTHVTHFWKNALTIRALRAGARGMEVKVFNDAKIAMRRLIQEEWMYVE